MQIVEIGNIKIGDGQPLALIAGPCVLEDMDVALFVADKVKSICEKLGIPYIFKSSYEKDNRGSPTAYSGPGLEKGLEMLARVKKEIGVPVLSDVHRETDAKPASEVIDILQIPAYLCQQTSLLFAVGKVAKAVNVKKGQFLAPESMKGAIAKLKHVGCHQILLTERGTCFGYNRLVSDMRSIPIMKSLGYPVVYDATHIVRLYGIPSSDPKGGEPEFVPHLVRAAVAAGTNALFLEVHPCPPKALCDAASMLALDLLEEVLTQAKRIADLVREMKIA